MTPMMQTWQAYYQQDRGRFGGLRLWLLFRALPVLLGTGLLLLLLAHIPANANEHAVSVGEAGAGVLWLQEEGGPGVSRAVGLESTMDVAVSGMIATVTIEQAFRNETSGYVEGVYAFPLPDNAAVRFLEMEIGERRIIGKVRERAEASRLYDAAKRAGKKASLVEQQRPNLFTNRVANIGPGETIRVRMEYVETVRLSGEAFSLRLPTTLTARYMPGKSHVPDLAEEPPLLQVNPYLGWAANTDEVPDAATISPMQHREAGSDSAPLNPVVITATLDMGMPLASVESPYHDIALQRSGGVYTLTLAHGPVEMDRDFELRWQPVVGATPQAALFTERVGGEYYGLLMVVPPAARTLPESIPREVIFVVDTSGSMGGVSIEQARASVERALRSLRPQDRFNVISFSSSYRKLYAQAMPADRHHLAKALEFVRLLSASGGTEMMPALMAALDDAAPEEGPEGALRQVVFVTDGAVGNEMALFRAIQQRIADQRLFTVGIGAAPNSWFMRKAAEFGRGSHTHIGDLSEVEQKMAALFEHLSRPAATDIAIHWPTPVEAWPARSPDLYAGEPLMMAVHFGQTAPSGNVVVNAAIGLEDWRQVIAIAPGEDPERLRDHSGVASVWARKKIAGLLDGVAQGQSEDTVRAAVLPIALEHQLLSPYTSFIAIEEVVSRPIGESLDSKAVPNTRPRGQTPQPFAFPATATTGPAKLWLGALLLFGALVLRVVRQPEVDHVPA